MIYSSNLLDVLALKLRDELLKTGFIGIDTNGRQNALDVVGRRRGVASKAKEQVSCQVLHFD